jgi:hypothetical protein
MAQFKVLAPVRKLEIVAFAVMSEMDSCFTILSKMTSVMQRYNLEKPNVKMSNDKMSNSGFPN